MSEVRRAMAVVSAGAMLAVAGCATVRIVDGVFRSTKGYRVSVPPTGWSVVRADADLELRRDNAAIAVNATCGDLSPRATPTVLARHLLAGVREREVLSAEDISLDGRVARHAVLDARAGGDGEPVRLELYVMRDARCVYDLVYAAPRAAFDEWRPAFGRVVDSFQTE